MSSPAVTASPTPPASGRFDVIIAGGGHAGLTLALALAKLAGSQIRIAVVERLGLDGRPAVPDPRAYAIAASSQRLLSAIGVWPRIGEGATPVDAIDITDSSLDNAIRPVRLSYANHLTGATGSGPATWIVEAPPLQAALLAQARLAHDITLLSPATVDRYVAGAGGVTVTLCDQRQIKAGLLVAADGARSPIREAAGIKTITWSTTQAGIATTVVHERPHGNRAVQHFLPAGPFAMLPLSGHRCCITWTEDAVRARSIVEGDDASFLAEVDRRFGGKLGAVRLAGPRRVWPLAFRVARALVAPRVALIGDAARTVHPIAGQGLNLALRDVAALAECVVDAMRVGLDAGDLTALERYERWRRVDSNVATASFAALNVLFSNDSNLLRMLRGAGLGLVDRLPVVKQLLVHEAAGLTGELPRLLESGPVLRPGI